jgi:hypothetical protein
VGGRAAAATDYLKRIEREKIVGSRKSLAKDLVE